MSVLNVLNKKPCPKKHFALVLGEDSRSFLSTVRSLGRAGFSVHVICYDRTSISLKCKYISAAYFFNHQAYTADEWIAKVLALIEKYRYDIIFPCDERAIYPLWQVKKQFAPDTKLAIANDEAIEILFDKWKTKELAYSLKVPVAKGRLVKPAQYSYQELKAEFNGAFVIKPLQSFTLDSLNKRHKVVIIEKEQEYLSFLQSNDKHIEYLIEEYFAGFGEGLSILAWQGEVKAAFSYRRLAEPYSGGGSSYRESNEVDLAQLEAVKMIAKNTQLSGLAMFEFRRSADTGQWILVEVNARAWGGMPLADFAGIDFPRLYVSYLCDLDIDRPKDMLYKKVRARALLTDLYEIKRECEIKTRKESRIQAVLHGVKRLFTIGRIVTNKESVDSLRKDDVSPFINEMQLVLRNIFLQSTKKNALILKYRRWKYQKKIKNELSKKVKRKIIFVCYGNIIRSPFAKAYFCQQLEKLNLSIDIESFGFHKNEERMSPQIAITAASSFNCDLRNHRSRCLSQLDIEETDILFYFDEKNENMMKTFYKVNHAFSLSDFLDDKYSTLSEIDDPYESDVETIKLCYQKIQNALDRFIHIHKEALQ